MSKIIRKIKRVLGIKTVYQSETSKVRPLVTKYCVGYGCDVGFGGDKIVKENCVGVDYATPYAYTGKDKVDVPCDILNEEIAVDDNTFDYVYSSHLIEDFEDTKMVLRKFIRVLKDGGHLILVFPDQPKYEVYCQKSGQPVNLHHIHKNMGYDFMVKQLEGLVQYSFEIVYKSDCEIDYNVVMVVKIKK
jgi:ubiquinone/menaquinone biosynthesis C-methylase UbiE